MPTCHTATRADIYKRKKKKKFSVGLSILIFQSPILSHLFGGLLLRSAPACNKYSAYTTDTRTIFWSTKSFLLTVIVTKSQDYQCILIYSSSCLTKSYFNNVQMSEKKVKCSEWKHLALLCVKLHLNLTSPDKLKNHCVLHVEMEVWR